MHILFEAANLELYDEEINTFPHLYHWKEERKRHVKTLNSYYHGLLLS